MSRIPAVAVLCSLVVVVACSDLPSEPAVPADAPAFAAVYVPGEQQPNVDWKRGTYGIFPETEGQVLAQTFTPANSGLLGYIELPVGCEPGVLLNVKVRKGLDKTILYEANIAGLPRFVDGFQLIQVFDPADPETPDGLLLSSGRTYAFELAAVVGPDATDSTCGIALGPTGNSYDGGDSYIKVPGMPFAPLNEDLPFITLMR